MKVGQKVKMKDIRGIYGIIEKITTPFGGSEEYIYVTREKDGARFNGWKSDWMPYWQSRNGGK